MSSLGEHADDYLRLRRALGFKLERHGQLLPQLVACLETAGASTVRSELAISWARLPDGAHPRHWAARLAVARGFAAYMQAIDPATEVPPADVFAVRYQRPAPCLWSHQDICRLLDAARALRPPLRAASFEALFGLLAVTGMRVGEAIALDPDDVDLGEGVITIREAGRQARASAAGSAAPHDRRRARTLRQSTRAPVPEAEIESVLPLGRRHQARPQPGEQDAAQDHHRARPAHRDRPPPHT